jgi:small-conductance mechanosensitive channel
VDFWESVGSNMITRIAFPAGVCVVAIALALLLRGLLYRKLHQWAAGTKTCWDDIMVRATRLASMFWCIWLGLYGGLLASKLIINLPPVWEDSLKIAVPVSAVALGIYSGVMILVGFVKWYEAEVCPKTLGTLDNKIMSGLTFLIPAVGIVLGVIAVLNMVGIKTPAVSSWLAEHGTRIGILLLVAIGFLLAAVLIVPGMIRRAMRDSREEQTEEELNKRTDTLVAVVVTTLEIGILLIFLFMLLSDLGINIAPVLAGAGVVGIAIGFGAQSLVKDIIAGVFVILENQYRKGDVVRIADISGLVEEINLRRTILRDLDGIMHVVPNGEIRVASNFTKLWSRVNLNVSVSYDTDLERAMNIINQVGKELAEDPQWASAILTAPKALRIDNFGDSGIEIKILGETKPIRQWDVMGELRLRLKKAFDREGIEIPWPHTKVYFGNLKESLWPADSGGGKEPAQ